MRGKSPLLALVALASVLAVSGCASGHQYIKNDDQGVYARVPEGWAVYDEADLVPDASDRDLERLGQISWIRTIHGGDGPHVLEASLVPNGSVPSGVVQVVAVLPQDREILDLRMMRGRGNPNLDPLVLQDQPPPGGQTYTVLLDEPVERDGGYNGVHTIYAVEGAEGGAYVSEQTVLRNSQSTVLYIFKVNCSPECYFETYKDKIKDFVDSWTIQEVRS